MAGDGTIYAAMKAPGGLGMHDIYVLPPVDGAYPGFFPIAGAINTSGHEVAPTVDPLQRFLLYTAREEDGVKVYISFRDQQGKWSAGQSIPVLSESQPKFGAISRDGTIMFYVSHLQSRDSNPEAQWPLDLFDGPALEMNADIYWLSAEEVVMAQ
jgi:hypothetical protein